MATSKTTAIIICAIIGFLAVMHLKVSTAKENPAKEFRLQSFLPDGQEGPGRGAGSPEPRAPQPKEDQKGLKKLSINKCTEKDIMNVDGFGEKMARRIIEKRKEAGDYLTEADLLDIPGIGEKRLASLKEFFIIPAQKKEETPAAAETASFSFSDSCPFCGKQFGSDRRRQRTSYIYCPHCLKYLPSLDQEKSL